MPLVLVIVFICIFILVLMAVTLGLKFFESRRKKHVTDMLQTVAGPAVITASGLLKDVDQEERPMFDRVFRSVDLTRKTGELLQQAGLDWTPSRLLGVMAVAAIPGALVGLLVVPDLVGRLPNMVITMLLFAALPYFYVSHKRKTRLAQMEEQLPEGLDFLARSMRAGHAFTISLEMIGEELADPLGQEFRTLFNEQNLGAPLDVAMHNFSARVPLLDVRFFVSAVLLQRQTGGNLSEILTRLAYLIRERFRLKGQVKASSAHGRMTAMVLVGLPLITMLGLMAVAPAYLKGMAKDPDGRWLIVGSIVAQVLGNYFIRRIVKIKV